MLSCTKWTVVFLSVLCLSVVDLCDSKLRKLSASDTSSPSTPNSSSKSWLGQAEEGSSDKEKKTPPVKAVVHGEGEEYTAHVPSAQPSSSWSKSSSTNSSFGSTSNVPCTRFMQYDPKTLILNQVNLYENPDNFFSSTMMRTCHLHNIDFKSIMPRKLHSYVWIAYAGDSLARELFMGAVQRFTDYKPTWKGWDPDREWERQPLLGKHLGPSSDAEVSNYTNTYHKAKLVCCKLPYSEEIKHSGYSVNDQESCLFALHQDTVFFEDKQYMAEKIERLKLYLFEDINEYINDFVSPLFFGKFKCVSFSWAPKYSDAVTTLGELYQPNDHFYPSAVVMNMGLHDMNGYIQPDLDQLVKVTNEYHNKHQTMFILHSPSHIWFSAPEYDGNFTMKAIDKIIDSVEEALPKWTAVNNRYLDLFNLTQAMHKLPHCSRPDGIHFQARYLTAIFCYLYLKSSTLLFTRLHSQISGLIFSLNDDFINSPRCIHRCGYQAIVTQWDFNWLRYLGVIRHSLSEEELKDHYAHLFVAQHAPSKR